MVGGLGLQGLVIFEWTRLIGMERFYREEAPTEIPAREAQCVLWLTVRHSCALLRSRSLSTAYAARQVRQGCAVLLRSRGCAAD